MDFVFDGGGGRGGGGGGGKHIGKVRKGGMEEGSVFPLL